MKKNQEREGEEIKPVLTVIFIKTLKLNVSLVPRSFNASKSFESRLFFQIFFEYTHFVLVLQCYKRKNTLFLLLSSFARSTESFTKFILKYPCRNLF